MFPCPCTSLIAPFASGASGNFPPQSVARSSSSSPTVRTQAGTFQNTGTTSIGGLTNTDMRPGTPSAQTQPGVLSGTQASHGNGQPATIVTSLFGNPSQPVPARPVGVNAVSRPEFLPPPPPQRVFHVLFRFPVSPVLSCSRPITKRTNWRLSFKPLLPKIVRRIAEWQRFFKNSPKPKEPASKGRQWLCSNNKNTTCETRANILSIFFARAPFLLKIEQSLLSSPLPFSESSIGVEEGEVGTKCRDGQNASGNRTDKCKGERNGGPKQATKVGTKESRIGGT